MVENKNSLENRNNLNNSYNSASVYCGFNVYITPVFYSSLIIDEVKDYSILNNEVLK